MAGPGSSKRSSGPLAGVETVHALMDRPLVARASATTDKPVARVWDALVDPEAIRRYMFGTIVISDWTRALATRESRPFYEDDLLEEGRVPSRRPGRTPQHGRLIHAP